MARKRDDASNGENKGKELPSAVKESAPSIQSELYRGKVRKHDKRAMKIVNHFAEQSGAKIASADISQGSPIF